MRNMLRSFRWVAVVVVAGTARITRDDEVFTLEKNGHTFIPVGARHRIENPGEEVLHTTWKMARPGRVRVAFGAPMHLGGEDYAELARRVEDAVRTL